MAAGHVMFWPYSLHRLRTCIFPLHNYEGLWLIAPPPQINHPNTLCLHQLHLPLLLQQPLPLLLLWHPLLSPPETLHRYLVVFPQHQELCSPSLMGLDSNNLMELTGTCGPECSWPSWASMKPRMCFASMWPLLGLMLMNGEQLPIVSRCCYSSTSAQISSVLSTMTHFIPLFITSGCALAQFMAVNLAPLWCSTSGLFLWTLE